MFTYELTTPEKMEKIGRSAGLRLPIEQTAAWAKFQATVPGRSPWGALLIHQGKENGPIVGSLLLIAMHTHGFIYLLSDHGPVWKSQPRKETEDEALRELIRFVHNRDKKIVFLRISTESTTLTHPVLSMLAYDSTVVMNLTGGKDAMLQRMKQRGRYDVRKAFRRSHAVIHDETDQGLKDFNPYYSIMVTTARRDRFSPAPEKYYANMLHALGKKHSRLYVARIDGQPVAWFIATISGEDTVYYFGSSLSRARKDRVPDKMMFQMACDFSDQGYKTLDLMGIGSDMQPKLLSLNQFKTKFSKTVTHVTPIRDVPVRAGFYRLLVFAKKSSNGLKNIIHPHEQEREIEWYKNHAKKSSLQGKMQKAKRREKKNTQKSKKQE